MILSNPIFVARCGPQSLLLFCSKQRLDLT